MREADRLRAALAAANAKELERITVAFYQTVFQATAADREALLALLEQEGMTAAKLKQTAVFKRLVANTDEALQAYGAYLLVEMNGIITENIRRGLADGSRLVSAVSQMVSVNFSPPGIPVDAAAQALNLLRPDGELYSKLKQYHGYNAEQIAQGIINAVTQGRNPRVVAAEITKLFGVPLNDALRLTRTAQIYSYRRASHLQYAASEVVTGWTWYAKLDGNTCMSCVSMHGSVHGHNEELNDHHQGRCTAVPVVLGFNPVQGTGKEWFDGLSEAEQEKMMGKGKYGAWQEGKFDFEQLSAIKPDDVYGQMRIEASLKSLLGS